MMQKTERFGLVLSPAEKAAAFKLAQGESVASLIRRLIRQAAKDAGLWPPQPLIPTTEAAHDEQR